MLAPVPAFSVPPTDRSLLVPFAFSVMPVPLTLPLGVVTVNAPSMVRISVAPVPPLTVPLRLMAPALRSVMPVDASEDTVSIWLPAWSSVSAPPTVPLRVLTLTAVPVAWVAAPVKPLNTSPPAPVVAVTLPNVAVVPFFRVMAFELALVLTMAPVPRLKAPVPASSVVAPAEVSVLVPKFRPAPVRATVPPPLWVTAPESDKAAVDVTVRFPPPPLLASNPRAKLSLNATLPLWALLSTALPMLLLLLVRSMPVLVVTRKVSVVPFPTVSAPEPETAPVVALL